MTGLVLPGAGTVVTGAGAGIGAAIAAKLAAAGASVLVTDLDAGAAERVGRELEMPWAAVDVREGAATAQLVDRAWEEFGRLDLFCANAGVGTSGTERSTDAMWQDAFAVNVMSHVQAARALLPRWIAQGHGRLLTTVSAAGLLTMLGSAPYTVTKHAALAFSEWLRMTYLHRGIVVQALCPQGVDTRMLRDTGDVGELLLRPGAISADECAGAVIAGLADDRFLILPHPEVTRFAVQRATDPDRWLARMNRFQQELESGG